MNEDLKKAGEELLQAIRNEIGMCVMLEDADRLARLSSLVNMHASHTLVSSLRSKGLYKELTELCDKAGKM